MADILYIQLHDRPWYLNEKRIARRKKAYMPRVLFEVCYQIPKKYSVAVVDLNIELAKRHPISEVIHDVLQKENPKIVFISFCTFTQGEQLRVIIDSIRNFKSAISIIIGGSIINQIKNAPLKYFAVDDVYNGFGKEIPLIIKGHLRKTAAEISGLCWYDEQEEYNRGQTNLLDNYDPEKFYTLNGRINFDDLLATYQILGIQPIAMLEMTRGCTNNCSFCALNQRRFGFFDRSPQTVLKEAHYLAQKGIDQFHIIDPTFGSSREEHETLLLGLQEFYSSYPNVKLEALVRSDMITSALAENFAKAGIKKVDLGMESMDDSDLASTHKGFRSAQTRNAVEILSAHGIKVKLFHILFPGRVSLGTISYLLELCDQGVDFIVQSSFLRHLPNDNFEPRFLEQDQTVFVPWTDTVEQLMEYLLVNLAFPSMDWDKPDLELRESIRKKLREGGDLKSLFKFLHERRQVEIMGGSKIYTYIHPEPPDPVNYCIEERR